MTIKTTVQGVYLVEHAIRFVRWADSFSRPITAKDIQQRWGVSRATAYRWLNAYDNVAGGHPVGINRAEPRAAQVRQ